MISRYGFVVIFWLSSSFGMEDLMNAKVGACFSKVVFMPQVEIKKDRVEVQQNSKKFVIQEPQFKKIQKEIVVKPSYREFSEIRAKFKDIKVKVTTSPAQEVYATSKSGNIVVSKHMLAAAYLNGLPIKDMQVGECFKEYYKIVPQKMVEKEVVTREAFENINITAAKFKKVKKKVVIKPAYKKIIKVPAVYGTEIVKVLVQSSKKEWVRSGCKSGELECAAVRLVETPPIYKSITKRILKSPPSTKIIEFPAVYKEIEVEELVSIPSTKREIIPELKRKYKVALNKDNYTFFWLEESLKVDANYTGYKICKAYKEPKYKEFTKEIVATPTVLDSIEIPKKTLILKAQKLLSNGSVTSIDLPPLYEDVETKIVTKEGRVFLSEVVCKGDLTKELVWDIQTRLKQKGFYKSRIDGLTGPATKKALIEFQKELGLPYGGYTIKSLKALGMSF
jgi:hypothetical protein